MPRPWLTRALLTGGLVALAVVPPSLAQPPAGVPEKATVTFRTPEGKVLTEVADVKESAGRLELTYGKNKAVVNAPDVLKVEPIQLAGANPIDISNARTLEDGKDIGKAAASYADQAKKAAGAPDRTKRYFAYKDAALSTRLADSKTGADFDAEAKKAIEKWAAVSPLSRKSYEVWPAAKTTARLQAELNDYGKAAATLGALAATPDLPKELRHEALLLQAAMSLRGKQNAAVEATVGQLAGDKDFPATGGLRDRLNVLKVAAKISLPASPPATPSGEDAAKLQAAIDAAKDPVAKGVGYAALGELHLANGQLRDAMWAYLWVDVVYNQEHDDQVLAVARVAQLFDAMGDKDRADQFREKLTRIR